ncbi:MAG TPA: ATP-binding protein [Tepiditoga sp.]|mgnify:CR=1 FL=1|nr:ATP-binding protein [Tepiditoga sp.]
MEYLMATFISLLALAGIILVLFYIKNTRTEKNYKKIKNEISRILNININNPSDDFLVHQIGNALKTIKERYDSEKNRRKNIYTILDNLSEGVMFASIYNGEVIKIDFANIVAKKIFTVDDYIGRSMAEIVDNHSLIDMVLKSFKKKIDVEEEILFYSPEKRFYHCQVRQTQIDEKYRIIILNNITKEKDLVNLRKEFLTTMSHELRTPLAVINGYIETIMMDETLSDDVRKPLMIIEDETARLTRLVKDLLDIGRMEKSINESFNMDTVNLSALTKKAYDFFKMLSDEMGIELISEIEDNIKITGNDDRILQAIYNLIDNAIKFTAMRNSEEKTMWIRLYKDSENKNEVILEIEDTGIGIPSKELQKIFDMFYRVDKSRTRQISGFGLGLYIVKLILDNHKARLFLESEENNGTLFRINFKGGIDDASV